MVSEQSEMEADVAKLESKVDMLETETTKRSENSNDKTDFQF